VPSTHASPSTPAGQNVQRVVQSTDEAFLDLVSQRQAFDRLREPVLRFRSILHPLRPLANLVHIERLLPPRYPIRPRPLNRDVVHRGPQHQIEKSDGLLRIAQQRRVVVADTAEEGTDDSPGYWSVVADNGGVVAVNQDGAKFGDEEGTAWLLDCAVVGVLQAKQELLNEWSPSG
jgi:hypothetical protein